MKLSFKCIIITLLIILYSGSAMQLAFSAEGNAGSKNKPKTEPDSSRILVDILKTDNEKLLIFDHISHGIKYAELKTQLPDLTEMVTEGAGSTDKKYGLFEAYWHTKLFNRDARVEFNFRQDSAMYTYYFWLDRLDSTSAWKFYHKLQKFYANKYGPYKEDVEHEVDGVEYITNWDAVKKGFGLVLSIYGNTYTLGWGI